MDIKKSISADVRSNTPEDEIAVVVEAMRTRNR